MTNTYDAGSRRTKLDVYDGLGARWTTEYFYDSTGKSKGLKDGSQESWFLFDEAGRKVKNYFSNGMSTYYTRNQAGQLTSIHVEKAGVPFSAVQYGYDAVGNVAQVVTKQNVTTATVQYEYDNMGQLLKETDADQVTTEYKYDEQGNRVQVIKGGVATDYVYNQEGNRLTSVGGKTYKYDADGRTTSDGQYTYSWGLDNKLSRVRDASDTIVLDNTFDATGKRTGIIGRTIRELHYDGDLVTYVEEKDSKGKRVKVYRFAYDQNDRPVFMTYNGQSYWYHYDRTGSVLYMTDANG